MLCFLKKCPNFIRTIGWHLDNLMKWLVRLGSIDNWEDNQEEDNSEEDNREGDDRAVKLCLFKREPKGT